MRTALLTIALTLLAGCDFGRHPRPRLAERNRAQAEELRQALLAETERQRAISEESRREAAAAQAKAQAETSVTIIGWNIESGGNDPNAITERLGRLRGDIWALSEVQPTEFDRFASGRPFISTESGQSDRLMIVWDPSRFELIQRFELAEFNEGNHRAPLVAHLKKLPDGPSFLLLNNHLARGNEAIRLKQAEGLVEWARVQTLPIIAVGDYNFDFDFATQNGNDAWRAWMRDGIWEWIRPAELIDTNWADNNKDGIDDYPGSMLDFAFVAGPARDWEATCEVVVEKGDFPDDAKTSDHRPVRTRVHAR